MNHSLKNSNSSALCLSSIHNARDFVDKNAQDSLHWLSFYDLNFPKRYAEGNINLVLSFRSRSCRSIYQLVFVAVPLSERNKVWPGRLKMLNIERPCNHAESCYEPMFGIIAKLIQCPQEVVPSLVWLEPFKERVNLLRELFTHTVEATFEVGSCSAERKMNFGSSGSNATGNSICRKIKSRAEMFKDANSSFPKGIGQGPKKFDFVEIVKSLVIRFGHGGIWAGFEEPLSSPFELCEVLLCPANSRSSVFKFVSHAVSLGMKSNPKTSGEYKAFESLLKQVIQVPHSEIKAKLDAEKQSKVHKKLSKKDREP
jgi:hypothetical protein